MIRLSLVVVLLAVVLPWQQATVPQNPCEGRLDTQSQMNECAGFEYQQADAHLNRVYTKAIQYLKDDLDKAQKGGDRDQVKYDETAVATLRDAERAWLSYRDLQCKAARQLYEGGSMSPMIHSQCLTTLTEHRIADLKSVYENGNQKLE